MSNYANRQVCDVDIRYLATGKPFLFFSDANTTGQTISGDSVYALARGRRKVAFPNPMEGTLTIEAQVLPFEMFALMSDGKILTDGEYFGHEKVVATAAGSIAIAGTPEGKIYVYPAGEVNATSEKEGTFADGKVTATGIEKDKAYETRGSMLNAIKHLLGGSNCCNLRIGNTQRLADIHDILQDGCLLLFGKIGAKCNDLLSVRIGCNST